MTWRGRRAKPGPAGGDIRLHFAIIPTWCEAAGLWVCLEPVMQLYCPASRGHDGEWITVKLAGAAG